MNITITETRLTNEQKANALFDMLVLDEKHLGLFCQTLNKLWQRGEEEQDICLTAEKLFCEWVLEVARSPKVKYSNTLYPICEQCLSQSYCRNYKEIFCKDCEYKKI